MANGAVTGLPDKADQRGFTDIILRIITELIRYWITQKNQIGLVQFKIEYGRSFLFDWSCSVGINNFGLQE